LQHLREGVKWQLSRYPICKQIKNKKVIQYLYSCSFVIIFIFSYKHKLNKWIYFKQCMLFSALNNIYFEENSRRRIRCNNSAFFLSAGTSSVSMCALHLFAPLLTTINHRLTPSATTASAPRMHFFDTICTCILIVWLFITHQHS
jgi:antibiotic biosynthesis monooxygenase (ABM) superfamily enzyme